MSRHPDLPDEPEHVFDPATDLPVVHLWAAGKDSRGKAHAVEIEAGGDRLAGSTPAPCHRPVGGDANWGPLEISRVPGEPDGVSGVWVQRVVEFGEVPLDDRCVRCQAGVSAVAAGMPGGTIRYEVK